MATDEITTIRVREATRDRISAQRQVLEGGKVETADDILTRLLDELEGLRGKSRRGAPVKTEVSA